mgnify:CR=1 FL=1
MTTSMIDLPQTVLPTEEDAVIARECCRRLSLIPEGLDAAQFQIQPTAAPDAATTIPASALRLLKGILLQMANGNAVTLIPVDSELSIAEAADVLNVSRHFLVERIEQGDIPFRTAGNKQLISYRDVLAFKERTDRSSEQALNELCEQAQELGMGY